MCKTNDDMGRAIEYLAHIGLPKSSAVPLPKELASKVPVAFSHAYHLYQAEMLGVKVVWALDSTNEFTPAQTEKALHAISERLSLPVILVCPDIAPYNISRLVERKVDFIIPGKQMFIPSMMIDLKSAKARNADIMEKIHPLAQVILLWQLEKGGLQGMTTSEIAEILGFSYATANRAIRWLREKGLVTLFGDKEKVVSFCTHGKELWNKALPFLESPIEKIVYTDEETIRGMESGVNALSLYSMINREQQKDLAISKSVLKKIRTDKQFGNTRLEVWRYAPELLAVGNVVDPLSLYLSLRDDEDERIQMELDTLIENIKWSEE